MLKYYTVGEESVAELIIKKSRFITTIKPVNTEEEAQEFIRDMNKLYRDATHNVYAYRIFQNQERCSDDGEPSGTAGLPVLNVIKSKELFYTAVVVTRYFGGIMLGAGGLVRAYSQATDLGLEQGKIITRVFYQKLSLKFPLSLFGIIKKEIECFRGNILNVFVTDSAELEIRLPIEDVEQLIERVIEVSAAKVEVKKLCQEYV